MPHRLPLPSLRARGAALLLASWLLATMVAASIADAGGWQRHSEPVRDNPEWRWGSMSAVDTLRGMLYVYGGGREDPIGVPRTFPNWWAGLTAIDLASGVTRQLPIQGLPATRMLVDPTRNELILLGGHAETWFLSLSTMNLARPEYGKQPAGYGVAALDVEGDRLLVWDGSESLWTLSLEDRVWESVAIEGPLPPQQYGPTFYDARRRRLIVRARSTIGEKTWALALDGIPRWTVLPETGPLFEGIPHYLHDPHGDRLLVATDQMSVGEITLGDTLMRRVLRPYLGDLGLKRSHHNTTIAFDPIARRLIVYGGADIVLVADDPPIGHFKAILGPPLMLRPDDEFPDWVPDPLWEEVRSGPPSLAREVAVFDGARGRLWSVGGGWDLRHHDVGTSGILAGQYRGAASLEAAVRGLADFEMIHDTGADRLVLFGTFSYVAPMAVVTSPLDGSPVWTPHSVSGFAPGARRTGFSAIYDPIGRRALVFGGDSLGVVSNQTWALSLGEPLEWSRLSTLGQPPARTGHVAIYDPQRHRMIVHGGRTAAGIHLDDTWELSLWGTPQWTQLFPNGDARMPARTAAVAAYDHVANQLMIFGGRTGTQVWNDLWTLSLDPSGGWQRYPIDGPGPRYDVAGTYDPDARRWWLLGGLDAANQPTREVWSFTNPQSTVDVPGHAGDAAVTTLRVSPNPTRGTVTLAFTLPSAGTARLEVHDVRGRRIGDAIERAYAAGPATLAWHGSTEPGLYFATLDTPGGRVTRRFVIVR